MGRLASITAWIMAVAALSWLGWSAAHVLNDPTAAATRVNLWTAGSDGASNSSCEINVALSDATKIPPHARSIPDVAYLRRMFPRLQAVQIFGDGLDESQARALRDLHVTWEAPVPFVQPTITYLSVPPSLVVGQKLTVQGRVVSLPASGVSTVSLEGPDGTAETVELRGATEAVTPFTITSHAVVAPGRYEWKLRAGAGAEPVTLGVTVTSSTLPRVLLLQASPNAEAARLQRWLAESGAAVSSRTRVSSEHFRFAHAHDSPAEVTTLDANALTHFDVIVATEPALSELSQAEKTVLQEHIQRQGLGLLVIGEGTGEKADAFFAPWPQAIAEKSSGNELTRTARLHFSNGVKFDDDEATVLPGALSTLPLSQWLIRDTADRTLIAAVARGRGWVARSLVVDTWHWLQQGHADTFATYWSTLLSILSRPVAPPTGTWRLENPEMPCFVNDPVRLIWSGPVEARPTRVQVESAGAPSVSLMLAHSDVEPETATALFWPTQSGWQHVRSADGTTALAFFVQAANALSGVRVAARHRATAQLSANSSQSLMPLDGNGFFSKPIADGLAFLIFVLGAGYLWWSGRRAVGAR